MLRQCHLAVLVLTAACRLSDLSFHKPEGAGDDAMTDAATSDAGPVFSSCLDLEVTCGTGRTSCCESIEVPGGKFYRDYDKANDSRSGGKNHPAEVSRFRLDKYDVTVGRFRAFVNAGMGTQVHPPMPGAGAHARIDGSGWDPSWNAKLELTTNNLIARINCSIDQTWTNAPSLNDDDETRPMNCLTWYEAMAFCIWDGGYLPTEVEWNYAALGGDEQRAYPWSSPPESLTIDPSYASYSPDGGTNCSGDGMPGCRATDIVPVGRLPNGDGRWHHSDLGGNLHQWILDWSAPYPTSCTDCANLTMPAGPMPYRVMRGAAFVYAEDVLRGSFRGTFEPWRRTYILGARCARPL